MTEKSNLIAEKDRLDFEKDELVCSKERLWRAHHEIVHERDAEIVKLQAKNRDLELQYESILTRNKALEDELSRVLDRRGQMDESEMLTNEEDELRPQM